MCPKPFDIAMKELIKHYLLGGYVSLKLWKINPMVIERLAA